MTKLTDQKTDTTAKKMIFTRNQGPDAPNNDDDKEKTQRVRQSKDSLVAETGPISC